MCPQSEIDENRRKFSELEQRPDLPIEETAIKDLDRDIGESEKVPPERVRPLPILLKTLVYMEDHIMDKGRPGHDPHPSWRPKVNELEIYLFMFNRLRMISKELKMQGYNWNMNLSYEAITILERLVRYYIAYQHRLNHDELFGKNHAKQNQEQLVGNLQWLKELYDYGYEIGQPGFCRNEPEFRAYRVLVLGMNDPERVAQNKYTHERVEDTPEVRFSFRVLAAVRSRNTWRFFRLLEQAPYLNACLMVQFIPLMRQEATKQYGVACSPVGKETVLPAVDFMNMLGMEQTEELESHVVRYNLRLRDCSSGEIIEEIGDPALVEVVLNRRQITTYSLRDLMKSHVYVPMVEDKAQHLRIRQFTRREEGVFLYQDRVVSRLARQPSSLT